MWCDLEEIEGVDGILPVLARLPIALVLSIVIHELAHTVASLAMGVKVVGIAIISVLGGYTAVEVDLATLSSPAIFVMLNAGVTANIIMAWLFSEVRGRSFWRYFSMTNSLLCFLNAIPAIFFYYGEPQGLEVWQPIIGFAAVNDGSQALHLFLERGDLLFFSIQMFYSLFLTVFALYLFIKSERQG
ncbi:MAG: hypothetical protein ACXQS5_03365, partial [Candidatus Methanospirareceae archaeon]